MEFYIVKIIFTGLKRLPYLLKSFVSEFLFINYYNLPFKPRRRSSDCLKISEHEKSSVPAEPNVHFSPDGKWIIFSANFEGAENVYEVEISKTKK